MDMWIYGYMAYVYLYIYIYIIIHIYGYMASIHSSTCYILLVLSREFREWSTITINNHLQQPRAVHWPSSSDVACWDGPQKHFTATASSASFDRCAMGERSVWKTADFMFHWENDTNSPELLGYIGIIRLTIPIIAGFGRDVRSL